MAVSFNGLSSGIDTAALIKAAQDAQRAPVTQLSARKTSYNAEISGLGQIASKLAELKTMAADMAKTSGVLAFTVAVGDGDVLGATADGEASAARYDVTVTQLARAEKDRSAGFGSAVSEVKAGKLVIGTAGDATGPRTITIDAGDKLEDVVDKINASGAKVDASIISDGSHSYLQVVASDTGYAVGGDAADAITVSETYTGATGQGLGLTQAVAAQNALLSVDGLPVETRTNQPSDIVAGMTLDLKQVGSSTLGIVADPAGTKTKVSAFVTKTNELIDLVNAGTRTSNGARAVESDPAVERLGADVRALVTKTVGAQGASSSLARIGIQTDASGHLSIDQTKFDKALKADPRGVARLFTTPDSGLSSTVQALVTRYTDGVDGIIGSRTKALTKRIDQLDTQIDTMNGRIDRMGTTMQKQFTAMEKALQSYQSQGSALASLYS